MGMRRGDIWMGANVGKEEGKGPGRGEALVNE